MSTTKKIVLTLISVLSIIVGTSYFLGLAYFQTHFKIGTIINGFSCSFKSVDEAESLLSREVESYAMAVNTRNDGVEKISADDVGMKFTGRSSLIDIINKQDYKLWFIPSTDDFNLSADCYTLDDEMFNSRFNKLKCVTGMVKGEKAHVVETDGYYQVAQAVKGTELDKDKTKAVIETALRQWKQSTDLEEFDCYIDIEFSDEEQLNKNCKLLNKIQDTIITIDFDDRTETVDFSVVKKNFLNKNYAIDSDKVKNYLSGIAAKYDTVGVKRNFVTYDDRKMSIDGGDYGWKLDIDKTAEKLIKLIKKNKIEIIKPEYSQTAMSRTKNDIGYSYFEIDTKSRYAVLYMNGTPLVQTSIHVGDGMHTGFFKVRGKELNRIVLENDMIYEFDEETVSGFSGSDDIYDAGFSGVDPECVAIGKAALDTIYSTVQEGWPVVIY